MKIIYLLITLLQITCMNNDIVYVEISTKLGKIKLELYPDKAPITTNNFLTYINENRYSDFHFYRTVTHENQPHNDIKIEVIQGGLGLASHPKTLPAINHETTEMTGIYHKIGTVSMARLQPGTASSEIFICISDQPELDYNGKRNKDGKGFAAFGRVISGMGVVKKIHSLPNTNQMINNVVKVNSFKIR